MDHCKKNVLAVDFGASGGRAVLGYLEDGRIRMEEIYRFSNDPVILGGTMYWDTLRQYYDIRQSMVKARLAGGFESIGIDTWGVDFGLIDSHGELLESAVHYRDSRTAGIRDQVFAVCERDRLYDITGIQVEDFNTIYQVYSLVKNRPWMLERADKLLLTPDLFGYFLSGEMKAEYTIASTTQLLDARKRTWSGELMDSLGISRNLFPDIVPSGTVIGSIKGDICDELGIFPAKVVAVAGHDTQSAAVAVPTEEEEFAFISCGTWSIFGTGMKEALIGETSRELNMSNEGGYGNTNTFLKNIIGLWIIQESRRQWIREGQDYSFGELEKLAGEAKPFVSFIDPDAPEFTPAGDMPRRVKDFCKKTGQRVPETVGEVVRCINQSLALKYRYALEQIEACTQKRYPCIHLIGGGIQSEMLCEMTACASKRRVLAGPVEATALGNIAVQMVALGMIENIREARKIIAASEKPKEYTPRDEECWGQAYERFLKLIDK